MNQSFLHVDNVVHVSLDCPVLNRTGTAQEGHVYGLASTMIALRNRDVDTCSECVRPT